MHHVHFSRQFGQPKLFFRKFCLSSLRKVSLHLKKCRLTLHCTNIISSYCNNISKFLSDDVAIISTVISSISIFLSTFTLYIFLHSSLRRVVITVSANNQSFFNNSSIRFSISPFNPS